MRARVRLGGQWLDAHYDTGGLKFSTIFRRDAWSGDYQASVNFAAPASFEAAWFAEGQVFEVVKGGEVIWQGVVTEKTPGDSGWSVHAFGLGSLASNYAALHDSAGTLMATTDPDQAITRAIAAGWPVRKVSTWPAGAASSFKDEVYDVATLLTIVAQNDGKRWGVDSEGALELLTEPTTPTWTVSPGDAYLGTVDDEYVTTLHGYYVATLKADGVTPDTYGSVTATDSAAVAKFGVARERMVDLTALGLLSAVNAQLRVDARLLLIGGRTGWTNSVTLSSLNVRRINGSWADPDMVKAGEMLRVPGVMDSRSSPTTRGSIDIVLAEVEHDVDAGTSTAVPLGFIPRDFAGALAAPTELLARNRPVESVA